MATRKKIPDRTETDVIYNADRKCCICKDQGNQIHHLDGKRDNNQHENLVFLCFKHHDEAETTSRQSKKLKKGVIIKYRDEHYEAVAIERANARGKFSEPVTSLSSEHILQGALDALIIVELDKIENEYFSSEWDIRKKILDRLDNYVLRTSSRAKYEVLSFLEHASSQTRDDMPVSVAVKISRLAMSYFRKSYSSIEKEHENEAASLCIAIGFNIAYDSAIWLRKLGLIPIAMTLWKYVYKHAKRTKNTKLKGKVNSFYDDLEATLKRPERNDLGNALELVRVFRNDLDIADLSYPIYPQHLMRIIRQEGGDI